MNDFGKFYYAAVAYINGQDMYGPSAATLIRITETEWREFWNLNPPHFHLLLPLALLPPYGALGVWSVASLLGLITSLHLIIREAQLKFSPWQWRLVALGLLSFVGTASVIVTGQLSWLLLLSITLAWLEARHNRWTNAGIYLGLAASVKPFLLIFIPYLVIRRQFRAVVMAGVVILLSVAVGMLVFGLQAHRGWLNALSASPNWTWAPMCTSVLGIFTRSLSENVYFAPIVVAPGLVRPLSVVLASIIGMLTLIVAAAGATRAAVDRGFALLLLGSQLLSPVGWTHYAGHSSNP